MPFCRIYEKILILLGTEPQKWHNRRSDGVLLVGTEVVLLVTEIVLLVFDLDLLVTEGEMLGTKRSKMITWRTEPHLDFSSGSVPTYTLHTTYI
jgi:hypothetical protein